jgi:phosphate transport system substrate-binding protein
MMKAIKYSSILWIIGLLIPINTKSQTKEKLQGNITISGAFALYPMAIRWAEEFQKINPGVRIDVSAGGAGKGMMDVLSNMVDIGMVSREIHPDEAKKGALSFSVAKDAVVATVNASNPVIKDILSRGLKKDAAANIWITGKVKTWGQALGIQSAAQIRVYTRSDACGAAETWAKYFGKMQEDLLGVGVYGDPGLAEAVTNDALGIGFNNIAFAYNLKTKLPNDGIKIVPLDLNNNGKIDADENFYDKMDDLINAIATDKYPSPPARDLYFVTSGKPVKKELVEFIKWVLTDGQKYVFESGYINIPKEKLEKELSKIK